MKLKEILKSPQYHSPSERVLAATLLLVNSNVNFSQPRLDLDGLKRVLTLIEANKSEEEILHALRTEMVVSLKAIAQYRKVVVAFYTGKLTEGKDHKTSVADAFGETDSEKVKKFRAAVTEANRAILSSGGRVSIPQFGHELELVRSQMMELSFEKWNSEAPFTEERWDQSPFVKNASAVTIVGTEIIPTEMRDKLIREGLFNSYLKKVRFLAMQQMQLAISTKNYPQFSISELYGKFRAQYVEPVHKEMSDLCFEVPKHLKEDCIAELQAGRDLEEISARQVQMVEVLRVASGEKNAEELLKYSQVQETLFQLSPLTTKPSGIPPAQQSDFDRIQDAIYYTSKVDLLTDDEHRELSIGIATQALQEDIAERDFLLNWYFGAYLKRNQNWRVLLKQMKAAGKKASDLKGLLPPIGKIMAELSAAKDPAHDFRMWAEVKRLDKKIAERRASLDRQLQSADGTNFHNVISEILAESVFTQVSLGVIEEEFEKETADKSWAETLKLAEEAGVLQLIPLEKLAASRVTRELGMVEREAEELGALRGFQHNSQEDWINFEAIQSQLKIKERFKALADRGGRDKLEKEVPAKALKIFEEMIARNPELFLKPELAKIFEGKFDLQFLGKSLDEKKKFLSGLAQKKITEVMQKSSRQAQADASILAETLGRRRLAGGTTSYVPWPEVLDHLRKECSWDEDCVKSTSQRMTEVREIEVKNRLEGLVRNWMQVDYLCNLNVDRELLKELKIEVGPWNQAKCMAESAKVQASLQSELMPLSEELRSLAVNFPDLYKAKELEAYIQNLRPRLAYEVDQKFRKDLSLPPLTPSGMDTLERSMVSMAESVLYIGGLLTNRVYESNMWAQETANSLDLSSYHGMNSGLLWRWKDREDVDFFEMLQIFPGVVTLESAGGFIGAGFAFIGDGIHGANRWYEGLNEEDYRERRRNNEYRTAENAAYVSMIAGAITASVISKNPKALITAASRRMLAQELVQTGRQMAKSGWQMAKPAAVLTGLSVGAEELGQWSKYVDSKDEAERAHIISDAPGRILNSFIKSMGSSFVFMGALSTGGNFYTASRVGRFTAQGDQMLFASAREQQVFNQANAQAIRVATVVDIFEGGADLRNQAAQAERSFKQAAKTGFTLATSLKFASDFTAFYANWKDTNPIEARAAFSSMGFESPLEATQNAPTAAPQVPVESNQRDIVVEVKSDAASSSNFTNQPQEQGDPYENVPN